MSPSSSTPALAGSRVDDENSLKFMATFPAAGRYRLFLQFQTDCRVHSAAFTQHASR